MSSRNLSEFESATKDLFVPIKDVKVDVHDTMKCRIIKFGKKNVIEWKPRLNDAGDLEDQKPTTHLRIYLYIYEYGKAKNRYRPETEFEGKFITINPQVKHLSELKALHEQLSSSSGDNERIFKHKLEFARQESFFKAKDGTDVKYTFYKVSDLGPDPNFKEFEHETVSNVDTGDNGVEDHGNQHSSTTHSSKKDSDKKDKDSNISVVEKIKSVFKETDNIDSMTEIAKNLIAKTDRTDVKDKIILIFNECKIQKIKEILQTGKDANEITQLAEFLVNKHIKSSRSDQIKEINDYADELKDKFSRSQDKSYEERAKYLDVDEVPF